MKTGASRRRCSKKSAPRKSCRRSKTAGPLDCVAMHQRIIGLAESAGVEGSIETARAVAMLLRQAREVRRDLLAHVKMIEGKGGLFTCMAESCPRMLHSIDRLRGEHDALSGYLDSLIERLATIDPTRASQRRAVRSAARDLLQRMEKHQEHGNRVVIEVYNTDLGGSD